MNVEFYSAILLKTKRNTRVIGYFTFCLILPVGYIETEKKHKHVFFGHGLSSNTSNIALGINSCNTDLRRCTNIVCCC